MEIGIKDLDKELVDPGDAASPAEQQWTEAAVIRNNAIYGNYVVASRVIQEGELLIEELPLSTAVYGTSDRLPFCLACGRDVALSERCSKCKWPICDNQGSCEQVNVEFHKSTYGTFKCKYQWQWFLNTLISNNFN